MGYQDRRKAPSHLPGTPDPYGWLSHFIAGEGMAPILMMINEEY